MTKIQEMKMATEEMRQQLLRVGQAKRITEALERMIKHYGKLSGRRNVDIMRNLIIRFHSRGL